LPRLRQLYELRVRFQEIFDTAPNRRRGTGDVTAWTLDIVTTFPELEDFVVTYEHWQDEILRYFDARQTSGPVEGINNKARVIVKRAYGLKSADSLWTRLVLDLNWAGDVVRYTIGQVRDMAAGLRRLFSWTCT
jgi:transposase